MFSSPGGPFYLLVVLRSVNAMIPGVILLIWPPGYSLSLVCPGKNQGDKNTTLLIGILNIFRTTPNVYLRS